MVLYSSASTYFVSSTHSPKFVLHMFYFPSNLLCIPLLQMSMLSSAHTFWIQNVTSDPLFQRDQDSWLQQLHSKKLAVFATGSISAWTRCIPALPPLDAHQPHIPRRFIHCSTILKQPQYLKVSKFTEISFLSPVGPYLIPNGAEQSALYRSILRANGNSWPVLWSINKWYLVRGVRVEEN